MKNTLTEVRCKDNYSKFIAVLSKNQVIKTNLKKENIELATPEEGEGLCDISFKKRHVRLNPSGYLYFFLIGTRRSCVIFQGKK